MVHEVDVLFRVQHLQQGRSRVTLHPSANLVYLVNQDKRVLRTNFLETLDNLARHGTNVSSPVTFDLCHVSHPTNAEPVILWKEGMCE